ncbi:MAG: SRPBCC family protein [Candidatus Dormibacteraeota bacterium]|nr:SRPBCC family protein [Candidatus Dormibacteraeota bacterium]
MPTYGAGVDVDATPAQAFAYVADLTRHGEWSADPLEIRPLGGADGGAGSRYQATAEAQGKTITAQLEVTETEVPRRFGFRVSDLTGDYEHVFTFAKIAAGTRVERRIRTSKLSLPQLLLFYVVFFPVKLPNTKRAMERLKAHLEEATARPAAAGS